MIGLDELFKEYACDKDVIKLSSFIVENKKTVVLYCFNEGVTDWKTLRTSIAEEFKLFQSEIDKPCHNDKNAVDWIELSNTIKRYNAFANISQAESSRTIEQSNNWVSDMIDPFANAEDQYISSFVLNYNIAKWRETAQHETKLLNQDLLYYNILDLVDTNQKNGSHKVLANYFNLEQERRVVKHKQNKQAKDICSNILKLKDNTRETLKQKLKNAKKEIKSIVHDDSMRATKKMVMNICKVYVDIEKENVRLYEKDTNEGTYLMVSIRPMLRQVSKPLPTHSFKWLENVLLCKKDIENDVLAQKGECAIGSKIDAIIINDEYSLEVGVLEISDPNYKVDTTHFIEDRIKIAKNLKAMYRYIMHLRDDPYIVIRKTFKVYGIHIYLNKLYVYSLSRPTQASYVFVQEHVMSLPCTKHVVNSLPRLISDLWIIQDLFIQQQEQLQNFLSENEVSPQSSQSSIDSAVYVSPRKKQRTQQQL